ncbi:MAG: hypothetical protein AAGA38_13030 [Pseudomonadota bacterium]
MYTFLAILVLLVLLGVCILQLSKHGLIDLPTGMTPPSKSDDEKSED